jgi:hypothetical protein
MQQDCPKGKARFLKYSKAIAEVFSGGVARKRGIRQFVIPMGKPEMERDQVIRIL